MIAARRSRMRRQSTGKRLELTDRDRDIFRALAGYRFLRSTYLHAFVGGASETRFKERLGDLFHEGFLDRPTEQWRFADCRHQPVVHELGAGTRRILSETSTDLMEQRTWLRNGPHRQFEHALMVCEVLASIELATRGRPDLRFIPWSEIRAKASSNAGTPFPAALAYADGQEVLVPDALFGIEYNDGVRKCYRFFALEADRGTMPVSRTDARGTSVLGKIAAYREAIAQHRHKVCLGVPNLVVLLVTVGKQRAGNILAALEAQPGPSSNFLVQSVAAPGDLSRTLPGLLTTPWARAGHAPLDIGDPG